MRLAKLDHCLNNLNLTANSNLLTASWWIVRHPARGAMFIGDGRTEVSHSFSSAMFGRLSLLDAVTTLATFSGKYVAGYSSNG